MTLSDEQLAKAMTPIYTTVIASSGAICSHLLKTVLDPPTSSTSLIALSICLFMIAWLPRWVKKVHPSTKIKKNHSYILWKGYIYPHSRHSYSSQICSMHFKNMINVPKLQKWLKICEGHGIRTVSSALRTSRVLCKNTPFGKNIRSFASLVIGTNKDDD